jgi:hypothetical protein
MRQYKKTVLEDSATNMEGVWIIMINMESAMMALYMEGTIMVNMEKVARNKRSRGSRR